MCDAEWCLFYCQKLYSEETFLLSCVKKWFSSVSFTDEKPFYLIFFLHNKNLVLMFVILQLKKKQNKLYFILNFFSHSVPILKIFIFFYQKKNV